jgi:hypothetical protein
LLTVGGILTALRRFVKAFDSFRKRLRRIPFPPAVYRRDFRATEFFVNAVHCRFNRATAHIRASTAAQFCAAHDQLRVSRKARLSTPFRKYVLVSNVARALMRAASRLISAPVPRIRNT